MGLHGIPGDSAHAHPPTDRASSSLLSPHVVIDVLLSGCSTKSDAADLFCPQVRRSPFTNTHAVNHLDVVSCWKGLSLGQASELLLWERFHNDALVGQVSEALRAMFLHDIPLSPDSTSFKSLLVDNILLNNTRVIQVDIQRLVYDMIARLYQQTAYGQQSMCSWSSATHPAMVFNFVRTRDYYLEALPKCYVQITLSHIISPSALKIAAIINWQPPAVEFLALPISLSPGEEYVITPEYIGQTLGCSVFPMCTTDVEFSVSSNRLPVRWDPSLRCFRAPVPNVCTVGTLGVEDVDRKTVRGRQFLLEMYGASPKVSSAETTFTANIIMDFPDNVRFERTTRYNIKLAITDPAVNRSPCHFPPIQEPCWPLSHANKRPTTSLSHSPPHPQRNMVECSEKHKRPREDHLDLFCTDVATAKNKRKASEQFPTRTMFEKVNTFEENSRFALDKFEHTDLELITKRQKVGKRADSGVQMNLDSFDNDTTSVTADDDIWMGENLGNFTTKCSGNATANGALPTYETGFKFTPSLRKKSSVRRVVFPRSATSTKPNVPSILKQVDSAAPDLPSVAPDGEVCPLDQSTIQQNYLGFLRSSINKTARLVSNSSSSDEKHAFERIFLVGDDGSAGEEWDTEVEDSRSVDMVDDSLVDGGN